MSDSYAPPELVTGLTQRLHALFSHLDNRRYDDVANLFLPQGRWLRQGRWLEGRQAILGALGARPAAMKVRHVVTNILVTPVADSEAHVEAYMTAFRQLGNDAPTLFRINLVTSVYRLEGGAWLLAEQQLLPEFDFSAGQ